MTVYEVLCEGYRVQGLASLIRAHDDDRCYETLKGDSRGRRYGAAKVIVRAGDCVFVHREDAEELLAAVKKAGYARAWIDTRVMPDGPGVEGE